MINGNETSRSVDLEPLYELRVIGLRGAQYRLEVVQRPNASTPRVTGVERVAGLHGRPLDEVESRILKRLKRDGIRIPTLRNSQRVEYPLQEDTALMLSLLFRVIAPMHHAERIQRMSAGIDSMSREEAGYWLGMAVHRKYPRRVLAALRMLLMSE